MANNLIQIKRSANTATPGSLQAGELAFSNVTGGSGVLFIGSTDGGTVVPIGGVRNPGTLTANQALVANSTSGIDKIITANVTLSGASVNAINAVANLTHLGAAGNNELTTTWAIKTFVDAKVAQASNPQGANGEFQYNNSGVLAGTNNMLYDNTTGRITVGNSSVNVQIGYTGSVNALAHFHGQQNGYVQVIMNNVNSGTRASSDFVAENDLGSETGNYVDLGINSSNYNDPAFSAMGAGDAYLYTANNDLVIGAADPAGGELRFITGGTTTSEIRATITTGGNVGIGNTTPNAKLQVTGTANISGATTLGSTLTVNGVTTLNANLTLTTPLIANGGSGSAGQILTSNGTTGSPYWTAAPTTVAGSTTQVQYNDGGSLAGAAGLTFAKATNNVTVSNNLLVTAAVNAASHTVGALFVANTTQVTLNGIGLSANGSLGSQGQALYSNGATGSPYWAAAAVGTITGVTAANGLVGGGSSGTVQLDVGAGNGISVSADAVAVNLGANSGLVVNTTGLYVSLVANSGLATNSSGLYVASGNGLTTNSSALSVRAGDSTIVSNSSGVYVNPVLSITDLTLSGNLIVSGTVTSVNTTTLIVKDNVVEFASNNTTTDVVDSGFFSPAGNSVATWYSGLARIAAKSSTSTPYYWLFNSNTNPNTATTIGAGSTGTLEAYLAPYGNTSSVFVVNSSAITITANSTVAATLTINSVSLTTALAATSGGTGQSSYATGDLLYATSTTALGKLAVPGTAANGQVLQITNNLPAYGTLDGGTF